MRTTAILNLKGGVAKTVTVVNMAAILARIHSKRVLVVDADAQGNTTEFLGGCEPTRCSFATCCAAPRSTLRSARAASPAWICCRRTTA